MDAAERDAPAPRRGRLERGADRVLVLAFLAALAAPLADALVRPEEARSVQAELRSPAPRPELPETLGELERFPAAVDAWYSDAFGLRDVLIRGHNALRILALGTAPTPALVVGADDWLFFTGGRALESHRGVAPMSLHELETWRCTLEARRDWLALQGIPFLYVIVPEKNTVYPERLPAGYEPVGPSRREQLGAYLAEHSDVAVLDLTAAQRAEAARDAPPWDWSYYPLGTHWEDRGAFAGYRAILERMRAWWPALEPWERADFAPRVADDPGDSWALRLYLEDLLPQKQVLLEPVRERRAAAAHREGVDDRNRDLRWTHPDASLPRLLVFNDSFAWHLFPYLAEHFSEISVAWQPTFDPARVARERPDGVLQVYVERALVTHAPRCEPGTVGAWVREQYERSGRVLLADPLRDAGATSADTAGVGANGSGQGAAGAAGSADFVRVGGTALARVPRAGGVDLDVRTGSGTDLLELPPFPFPDRGPAIVHLVVTSPVATRLNLFWRTRGEPGYARERTVVAPLVPGRNELWLALPPAGLEGALRLRPGVEPGTYRLHAIEVRAGS